MNLASLLSLQRLLSRSMAAGSPARYSSYASHTSATLGRYTSPTDDPGGLPWGPGGPSGDRYESSGLNDFWVTLQMWNSDRATSWKGEKRVFSFEFELLDPFYGFFLVLY